VLIFVNDIGGYDARESLMRQQARQNVPIQFHGESCARCCGRMCLTGTQKLSKCPHVTAVAVCALRRFRLQPLSVAPDRCLARRQRDTVHVREQHVAAAHCGGDACDAEAAAKL
jgi:hypothetical protein